MITNTWFLIPTCNMLERLRQNALLLKHQTYSLYLAYLDPRTPWYAKTFVFLVIAYALSPIDLIPDFIPFIGYLDDLLIIPLGIWIAIKLIPPDVLDTARFNAQNSDQNRMRNSRLGMAIIIFLWVSGILILGWITYHVFIKYQPFG